jgi:preprotein translocase subunit YajC
VGYLIILVALFALMWFLLIRPQRRRSEAQMTMQDRLRIGDEIITAGGLHATVQSIEGEVLEIEIAPGTVVRLDRRAVAAVVSEEEGPEVEAEEAEVEEEESEAEQPISSRES